MPIEILLNNLTKKYNVGLSELVEILRRQGVNVEMNPNVKVSEAVIPILDSHFCKTQSMDNTSEAIDQKLIEILEMYDKKLDSLSVNSTYVIDDASFKVGKDCNIELNDSVKNDRLKRVSPDRLLKSNNLDGVEKDVFSIEEIVARIEIRDKDFLEYTFSKAQKAAIHKNREIVKQVLDSEQLYRDNFWYFVFTLLEIDDSIYRGPICESVYSYSDIDFIYYKNDDELIKASTLLFRDKEKSHQAIHFFFPFRSVLNPIIKQYISDATQHLSSIEELELAFTILGSSIHDKLYLLSVNQSPASQYLGFISLKEYKKRNGIEAVKALKYFQTYMNCVYEYPSFKLIQKIILEDRSIMTDREADSLTAEGFNSYLHHIRVAEGRESKKRMTANIQELVGKNIKFHFVGENKWNIFGTTNVGCGFILPKYWTAQELTHGLWYQATVVKTVTNPNLLVLSQKKLMSTKIPDISTVYVGEYVEARFSLRNEKIIAEILSHGPTYAKLNFIPRNFDYKKKHIVKVISVHNVNKCEIEIADDTN